MGWLGWTESETLVTDMASIETAYRARHEMLQALAGREVAPAKITPAEVTGVLTPDLIAAMFGKK